MTSRGKLLRFVLWVCRYKTATITVGRDMGYGETMTVIYKSKTPPKQEVDKNGKK